MAAESPFGLITLDIWNCFMIWRQVASVSSEALAMQGEYCKILIIHSGLNRQHRGPILLYMHTVHLDILGNF